jgi:hypothetical protein
MPLYRPRRSLIMGFLVAVSVASTTCAGQAPLATSSSSPTCSTTPDAGEVVERDAGGPVFSVPRERCESLGRMAQVVAVDGTACKDAFAMLAGGSTLGGPVSRCGAENPPLGDYGRTVLRSKTDDPTSYRKYVTEMMANPRFTSCRVCMVLAERDLGLSLLLDEPKDVEAASRHLESSCRHAQHPLPMLAFVHGRSPCFFLPKNNDLRGATLSDTSFALMALRQCWSRSPDEDGTVLELAW